MGDDEFRGFEGTAGATIARFKDGAEKQLMLAVETLEATLEAVREGRFGEAEDRIQDAGGFINALATAERAFARLDTDTDIIDAQHLEIGNLLWGYGEIVDLEEVRTGNVGTLIKAECIPTGGGERREVRMDPFRKVVIILGNK